MVVDIDTFADESGMSANERYCVIAGYVSNPDQWAGLEREWLAEVRRVGVSEFKGKHFFNYGRAHRYRLGEYGDLKWKREDRRADQHLDVLLGIIEKYNIIPKGCAVSWAAFNRLSVEDQRFLTLVESSEPANTRRYPYYAMMFNFVAHVLAASDDLGDYDVRLNFVFDRQLVLDTRATVAFDQAVKDIVTQGVAGAAKLTRTLSFGTSELKPQLQAAEMLCYTWRRFLAEATNCRPDIVSVYERARKNQVLTVWEEPDLRDFLSRRDEAVR